ncbi:MAG: isochorismatase family cysteine hydrolase [Candidatus Micrarchaeales archaeon]
MEGFQRPAIAPRQTEQDALRHFVLRHSSNLRFWLRSENKPTLIVVDVQNTFCSPTGETAKRLWLDMRPIQKMIPKLEVFIGDARALGMGVAWVRAPTEGEGKGKSSDFDYYKIKPIEGDLEVAKFLDFSGLDILDKQFRQRGVKTILMAGVYARYCIDVEVREAHRLGYHTVLLSDLVADALPVGEKKTRINNEMYDWAGLENTRIISSKDLLRRLGYIRDVHEAETQPKTGR